MNLNFNILGRLNSGGGVQAFDSPAPLLIIPVSTERLDVRWLDVGQASSKIYRNTVDDRGTATEVYDGAAFVYSNTGLTRGQTYYFWVESDGIATVSGSASTIPVDVLAWFEFTGLEYATDNEYGTLSTYKLDVLKSVFGPSYTATKVSAESVLVFRTNKSVYQTLGWSVSKGYTLGLPLTLAGDFTVVMAKVTVASIAVSNNYVTVNTAGTYAIQIQINTSYINIRIYFNSVPLICTISTTPYYNQVLDIIWRRKGNDFFGSIDGGVTWTSATTIPTTDLVIDRLFSNETGANPFRNYYGERLVFLQGADYTVDELDTVVNFLKLPDYTPESVGGSEVLNTKGLTYEALVDGHIADTMAWGFNSGNKNFDRLKSANNLHFFALNEGPLAPYYSGGLTYVYDSNTKKISNEVKLGYYVANTNVHVNNSVDVYDKIVDFVRPSVWYGAESNFSSFKRKSSGKNFNFTEINERVYGKGLVTTIVVHSVYYQCESPGVRRFLAVQEQGNSGESVGQYISILYSDDNFNHHNKLQVAAAGPAVGGEQQWLYHRLVRGTDYIYIFWRRHTTPDRFIQCGVLKSAITDGVTWSNLAETWSKNVDTGGTITISELETNSLIFDSTALVGGAEIMSVFVDEDDLPYCVITNGYNTGYNLWNNGTTKAIDFKSYVTSFDYAQSAMEVIKTASSTFHVFFRETTNANGRTAHLKTVDGGDNWTDEGLLNDDPTIDYGQIFISKNHHFNSDAILMVATGWSVTTPIKGSITEIKLNGSYII